MVFRRALQRYAHPVEPETPYQRAGQLWDERIGSARVQAKNWRLVSFGTLGMALLLGGGMLWQASQSRVTPYVVQVDKFGAVQAIGPAIQNYSPTDAEIAWYLARFVTDVRSLSLDPVVVRRNWLEAYDYATDHGAFFLNQYAQANDPFKAVGDAPPLFVKGNDGNSDLVNYRVRGNYYVVDQLFATAELRLGQDHQQVVCIKRTVRTADSDNTHHTR
jgi:type IV secretion system protein VirB5